ncbi:MAG: hypothetical protein L3J47_00285 [Sulfurovum sp.]|nr:hypothetical protein [Sulfurovum sp.]
MKEKKEPIRGTRAMLFGFEILINGVLYDNSIETDLRIDRTVLETEFAGQTTKYCYYATLAALAKDQEAKLKRIAEITLATADHKAREEALQLAATGDKRKFTEKMYDTMAKTNQDYQLAQLAHLDAKHLADKLTRIEHAFAQRKEMLISLGAHARVGASDPKVLGSNLRSEYRQRQEIVKEEIVEEAEEIVEEITKQTEKDLKEKPPTKATPTTVRKRRRKKD